jgi:hypothetical protein
MKQRSLKNLCDESFGVGKRRPSVIPVEDDLQVTKAGIQKQAEQVLGNLRDITNVIASLKAEAKLKMDATASRYNTLLMPVIENQEAQGKQLIALMKKNKTVLFDGTDVVNLPHGSLIHSVADKVSIPKTALDECKAQGFQDVIKIIESLDRDAISKWPDAKLVLIGAERKQKEEFSYNVKS